MKITEEQLANLKDVVREAIEESLIEEMTMPDEIAFGASSAVKRWAEKTLAPLFKKYSKKFGSYPSGRRVASSNGWSSWEIYTHDADENYDEVLVNQAVRELSKTPGITATVADGSSRMFSPAEGTIILDIDERKLQ